MKRNITAKQRILMGILIPIFALALVFGTVLPIVLRDKTAQNITPSGSEDTVQTSTGIGYDVYAETGASVANKNEKGGFIFLENGAQYTMRKGKLSGITKKFGGAVFVSSDCTFTMEGGEISGNKSKYGGAIYVANGGTCIIKGGLITANKSQVGSAIYVEEGGVLQVENESVIKDNLYEFYEYDMKIYVDGELRTVSGIKVGQTLGQALEKTTMPLDLEHCNGYFLDANLTKVANNAGDKTAEELLGVEQPQAFALNNRTIFASAEGTTEISEGEIAQSSKSMGLYTREVTQEMLDKLTFTLSGNKYTVKAKDNNIEGDVVIPCMKDNKNIEIYSASSSSSGAFYNCKQIDTVYLNFNATSIPRFAFHSSGLKGIKMHENIKTIGESFAYCDSLLSLTLPGSVTKMGTSSYHQYQGLKRLDYLGTIEQWFNIDIGINANPLSYAHNLYIDNELVENLVIPESVTELNNAIAGASCIKSVTIHNKVTKIGNSAFSGCSGLTSVTIPDSVASIGNSAFSGCSGLTSIIIPESVTTIGDSAFFDCSGLTSVTIPNSVTSIEYRVFFRCRGLTSVTIPNSVISIGSQAFYECKGLTGSLIIPDSVTIIGDSAFCSCSGLTNIYIPSKVTTISASSYSNSPFYACRSTLQIYTDVVSESEKPSGWGTYWNNYNSGVKLTTHYGASIEQYQHAITEGHTYGDWVVDNEPTCAENGSKHRNCQVCDYREDQIINPTGHTYGDWIVDKEATCTENGSKHRNCQVCDYIEDQIIKAGHIVVDGFCSVCGEEIPYTITNDGSYPFTESEGIITSANKAHGSTSNYAITAISDCTVTFEYNVSSENNYDWLYILKGSTQLVKKSGTSNNYTSMTVELLAGETLTFRYSKDSSGASGSDCIYIKDLVITKKT